MTTSIVHNRHVCLRNDKSKNRTCDYHSLRKLKFYVDHRFEKITIFRRKSKINYLRAIPPRPSILARMERGGIIAFHLPRRGSWKRQAYLFLADYPLSCIGDSRAGNASRLLARQRFKGCGCGRSYPAHESGHQCHAETRTNAPGKLHSA